MGQDLNNSHSLAPSVMYNLSWSYTTLLYRAPTFFHMARLVHYRPHMYTLNTSGPKNPPFLPTPSPSPSLPHHIPSPPFILSSNQPLTLFPLLLLSFHQINPLPSLPPPTITPSYTTHIHPPTTHTLLRHSYGLSVHIPLSSFILWTLLCLC